MKIQEAVSQRDLITCFSVFKQLRSKFNQKDFIRQVSHLRKENYRIIFVITDKKAVSAAGFHILQNLAWGKFIYIDDLITLEQYRSQGFGQMLFNWIIDYAKLNKIGQIHLDSAVWRYDAHRFYLRNKMHISSHHFSINLE
ncbi:hypothetical protein A3J15_03845 [Candidatus Roizmanbacteria bacterium RIFCSPLOWO2_02_FULL_38_10]|uniref:N-acetyltransferase domain-containing protein n=1 Tax=Candidatus Roizmanbacteria bacterium RIFCSPLOWO2_02_FULL_38_10 TaxID=1802074 RepID=A0A1F7JJL0_9BACT|nr:MAG: hypothetical protein A3J15_03845 [Candidatus Roizmanbacteria bacterium RIFCSPLOWO2_02_FULL_38_10]